MGALLGQGRANVVVGQVRDGDQDEEQGKALGIHSRYPLSRKFSRRIVLFALCHVLDLTRNSHEEI